jgi:hypothetical protein
MLTGTWILKREGDKGNPAGRPVPAGDQDVLTLAEDGSMTFLKKARDQERKGTWELSDDRKTLRMGDADGKEASEVLELSPRKLVVKMGPFVLTWEKGKPPPAPKAPPAPKDPLAKELVALWTRFREALRAYRLDEIRTLVEVRPEEPVPPRAQAEAIAEMLPDLAEVPCLAIKREGAYAGYYADTSPKGETEVTLVRFVEAGSGWRLVPAPHTMNAVGTDEKKDKRAMIEEEPSLRLVAEGMGGAKAPSEPAPPPAPAKAPAFTEDARPNDAIRKDLEALWARLREACGKGDVDAASAILLPPSGGPAPTAAELKSAAESLPDLAGGKFLRLVRSKEKPWLLGYYAALPGKSATRRWVVLLVFARAGAEWRFPAGPASIERVDVHVAESTSLDALLKKHAALRL